jgi:hypothetical protein
MNRVARLLLGLPGPELLWTDLLSLSGSTPSAAEAGDITADDSAGLLCSIDERRLLMLR